MTNRMALKFLDYKYLKRTDLLDNYKLSNRCNLKLNCRNFFYAFNSDSIDQLISLNFLVTINGTGKSFIYRKNKTSSHHQIILNVIKPLKFPVETVLFSTYDNNEEIIEFSNAHSLIRQFKLPAKYDSLVNTMTYFNLLNCFHKLCEGGRYKGLITLKNAMDGKYYQFFFLEDYYIQIDHHEIFESAGNMYKFLNL